MTSEVMASTTPVPFDGVMTTDPTDPTLLLRSSLRANAAFSTATGVAALAAGSRIAELAGIQPMWLVPVGGCGLLLFAGGLVWLATRPTDDLVTHAPGVVAADLGWVAATAVVVAGGLLVGGWLSTTGIVGALAIAAMVAGLAAAQAAGLHRIRA